MEAQFSEHDLRGELDRLARKHGPWHDRIVVADGVVTAGEVPGEEERRTRAVLQAVLDGLGGDLDTARVLDLGCAEGRHAVEFARQGAEVVAFEGREGNVEKLRFLKRAIGLDRLEVVKSDVRHLSAAVHGRFDAVLCLGLLYHLDGDSAVETIQNIAAVTSRLAVFDTHVALAPKAEITSGGRTYSGRRIREFDPGASDEEQERLSRSSIGNPESFWLTRASLFNAISDAGFSSVLELQVPRFQKPADRVTLLAFRGEPRALVSAPGGGHLEVPGWPENERRRAHPDARLWGAVKLRLAPHASRALKKWVRRRRGQPYN